MIKFLEEGTVLLSVPACSKQFRVPWKELWFLDLLEMSR
jgi:hypothetical protein